MGLLDLFRKTAANGPPARHTHRPVNFHVTLWPTFPHFRRFANDPRVQGIRLNSAMIAASEINDEFAVRTRRANAPLWFDVKGMQLRIKEMVCDHRKDHLEFVLNRPVKVRTPCPVWFKAGEDCAQLAEVRDGTHFIFNGGPRYEVRAGESIHLRSPEVEVGGPTFLDYEKDKINRIKVLGFTRWYLSYVYSQKHVDEFRELIGPDAEVVLKIENKEGLRYVAEEFKPGQSTNLAAARGDLYVELDYPHQVMNACKLIAARDRNAYVGSRMLLSLVNGDVPSCADLCELAWLYDVGYRNFLLCDELCLKEDLLAKAINVFSAFRKDYCVVD